MVRAQKSALHPTLLIDHFFKKYNRGSKIHSPPNARFFEKPAPVFLKKHLLTTWLINLRASVFDQNFSPIQAKMAASIFADRPQSHHRRLHFWPILIIKNHPVPSKLHIAFSEFYARLTAQYSGVILKSSAKPAALISCRGYLRTKIPCTTIVIFA
jgi:hypothetical protein